MEVITDMDELRQRALRIRAIERQFAHVEYMVELQANISVLQASIELGAYDPTCLFCQN